MMVLAVLRSRSGRCGDAARRSRRRAAPAWPTARTASAAAHAGAAQIAALKEAALLVDRHKHIGVARDVFRKPEEQIAARPQRIMKQRKDLCLQAGLQVDQQVAARNQVEARERRIADHAVRGKDAHLAQALARRDSFRLRVRKSVSAARARSALIKLAGYRAARATPTAASSMSVAKICTLGGVSTRSICSRSSIAIE